MAEISRDRRSIFSHSHPASLFSDNPRANHSVLVSSSFEHPAAPRSTNATTNELFFMLSLLPDKMLASVLQDACGFQKTILQPE